MRYYKVTFTSRDTHKPDPAPLFNIWARNAGEAKQKANREVLRDGRSRRYDLAWTSCR